MARTRSIQGLGVAVIAAAALVVGLAVTSPPTSAATSPITPATAAGGTVRMGRG